jgi:cytochrome c-type biogenesis protein CcmH/NrfF
VSSLVWLAIPLVALVLAVLWVIWTSRTRPRADTHETLEEHARFKAAFDPDRARREPRD